jgi:hypothetical protein
LSTRAALDLLSKKRFAAMISDMGREEGPREGSVCLVLTFCITVTYPVRLREPVVGGDLGLKSMEIIAGEGPVEGDADRS